MYVEPTPGAQPGTIAESNQELLTMASTLVNPSDLESVQSNRPDITIGDAPRRPIPGCGPSVKTEDLTEENSGTLLVPARRMGIDTSLEDTGSSRLDKRQLVSSNSEEGDDAEDIRPSKRARRFSSSSLQKPPSKSGTFEVTHEDSLIAIYLEDERFDVQKSRFLRHSESFSQVFIPDRGFRIGASALVGPWMLLSKTAVRIIGVSAADFKSLLEALDDVYDFMFDTPVFPKLASILRASTVLGFTKVTRFVVNCLEHMWPSDLSRLSHTRIPYAIETIEIARKNDIPQIRKRAFYEVVKAASGASIQDDNFGDMLSDKDRLLVYRVQAVFQKEWMMIAKAAPHTQCDKTKSAGRSSCCVHRDIRVQHWSVLVTESPVYDEGVQDIFVYRGLEKSPATEKDSALV
ncbi:unnamed protein product [Somion occarium]|uniref:BTB domain-containing protein n=1 Tax=Somion occarium TaxID=3059160 RepID=A0ABP1D547_9APHY